MIMNLKQPKIIIGIIIVFVLIISVILVIIFSRKPIEKPEDFATTLIKEKIYFPHLTQDDQYLYYFGNQGTRFKKYEFKSGLTQDVLDYDMTFISEIIWSSDDTKLAIRNNDKYSKNDILILDLKDNNRFVLKKNIKALAWKNDNNSVVYHYFEEEGSENYFAESNIDGSNENILLRLEYPAYNIQIRNDKLFYWSTPSDTGGTNLYVFNLNTKEKKAIFNDYRFENGIISYDGSKIAYLNSLTNSTLNISDIDGSNNKNMKIKTFINKFTWDRDSKKIFLCEPNDNSNDTLYYIDINNLRLNKIKVYDKYPETLKAEYLITFNLTNSLLFISNDFAYRITY